MKMPYPRGVSKVLSLAAVTIGLAGWTASGAPIVYEFQDFADSPAPDGWIGSNNVGVALVASNYGWSSTTNLTNNDAVNGEAGGTFDGPGTNLHSYYADTTLLGGTFTLNTPLFASGWIYFDVNSNPLEPAPPAVRSDPGLRIGFFNKSNAEADETKNVLGFGLADSSTTVFRIQPLVYNNGGAVMFNNAGTLTEQVNARFFTMDYNPAGNGTLTFNITGLGTNVLSLTAPFRATGATFNSFGLLDHTRPTTEYKVFIDDLTYTTAVPEPTTLGLFVAGFSALGLRRRR